MSGLNREANMSYERRELRLVYMTPASTRAALRSSTFSSLGRGLPALKTLWFPVVIFE